MSNPEELAYIKGAMRERCSTCGSWIENPDEWSRYDADRKDTIAQLGARVLEVFSMADCTDSERARRIESVAHNLGLLDSEGGGK